MNKILYKEDYTIVLECPDNYSSGIFNVYEVTMIGGLNLNDEGTPIYYYRSKDGHTDTLNYKECNPIFQGYIKWDGCIDFNGHAHFCGYRDALQIKNIIDDIYLLASENIEGFDNDLADYNNDK